MDEIVQNLLPSKLENYPESQGILPDRPIQSAELQTKYTEKGIQANDYEIERCGRVPARMRVIPRKFRDYENTLDIKEEPDSDGNYNPDDEIDLLSDASQVKKTEKPVSGRKRGRPKKLPIPSSTTVEDESSETSVTSKEISTFLKKEININQVVDNEETIMPSKRGRPRKGEERSGDADDWHECTICSKKFSLKGNLKQHMSTHSDRKPFICEYSGCTLCFRTKEQLRNHNLIHLGMKLFQCDVCQKRFSTNHALKEHVTIHSDTKLYQCNICQKQFRQISGFTRHMILHTGEKKYTCEVCGKQFAQSSYLRSHARTHTGEKRFKCEECGKLFGYRSDLNRHRIIHTGSKPYVCSVCNMRFSDGSSCRRHIKEHSEEPSSNMCSMCGCQFKRSSQLNAHIRKEHQSIELAVNSITDNLNNSNSAIGSSQSTQNSSNNTESSQTLDQDIDLQHVQDQIQQVLMQLREARDDLTDTDEMPLNIHIVTIPESNDPSSIVEILPQGFELLQNVLSSGGLTVYNSDSVENNDNNAQTEPKSHSENMIADNGNTDTVENSQALTDSSHSNSPPVQDNSEASSFEICAPEVLQNLYSEQGLAVTQVDSDRSLLNITSTELAVENNINSLCEEKSGSAALCTDYLEPTSSSEMGNVGQQDEAISKQTQNLIERIIRKEIIPDIESMDEESNLPVNIGLDTFSSDDLVPEIATKHEDPNDEIGSDQVESRTLEDPIFDSVFISQPEFSSQEYFEWLSSFVEQCQHLKVPIKPEIYLKITSVHKTLSEIIVCPTGVLSCKKNFKILLEITANLHNVISEHLNFVMNQINKD